MLPPKPQTRLPTPPPPPPLGARAATLVVRQTGQELYGLNANEELAIASTTKLMTALVTLRHASLNEVFTDPNWRPAPDDSQIGLTPGERMTVRDLMIAMLVPSADDAAEDLAYNVGGGSIPRFIAMMNAYARQLGLTRTHYSTPIGLDTPGNYSTARNLVKLATYLLAHYPFFAQVVDLPHAELTSGNYPRYVVNRNDLVGTVPWIHGVKTGHTNDAGYVLVAEGEKQGMTLLSAVLGTPSEAVRDSATLKLLDWGYANFQMEHPLVRGGLVARPTVNSYKNQHARVIATRSVSWVVPRGSHTRLSLRLPANLNGPRKRGTRVGTASVYAGSTRIATVPLILARALPGLSTIAAVGRFLSRPSTLVVLFILLAVLVGLGLSRRGRRRGRRRVRATA